MNRMICTAGLACALGVSVAAGAQTPAGQTTPPAGQTTAPKPAAGGMDHSKMGMSGTVAAGDKAFAMEAAQGGMAEVALGKLAADKASNADVKQFGQRVVDDHGKANDELKGWASQKGVTLPADLNAKHKATEARLSKLSGAAFDRAYMAEMVADHNKDVAAFQQASKTAKDADLKAWAAKTLPTLQDHQKMARELNTKVKGTAAAPAKTPTE
jgi:putative membrane protein